ncbi:hypothetical protein CN068_35225, partial [Sinorhizobium meliloti]
CNEPIHSPSSPNRDHLSRHPDRRAFPSKLSRHRARCAADHGAERGEWKGKFEGEVTRVRRRRSTRT